MEKKIEQVQESIDNLKRAERNLNIVAVLDDLLDLIRVLHKQNDKLPAPKPAK